MTCFVVEAARSITWLQFNQTWDAGNFSLIPLLLIIGLMYDWIFLDHFANTLEAVERTCSDDLFASFGGLSDELWRALLQKKYSGYPRIKSVLPDWPNDELQRNWVGNCGEALDHQSFGFIRNLKNAYLHYGSKELSQSTVLDFGVGWGRLIRYLAKDVPREKLWGCDSSGDILAVCQQTRVPGVLRQSLVRPAALPYAGKVDLAYAFSVFTHLSERTHWEILECIYRGLAERGIFVATVRPRAFLPCMQFSESNYCAGYLFVPHNLPPVDGDVPYGDAVIADSYIRSRWSKRFRILDKWWLLEDSMQVAYVLQKL